VAVFPGESGAGNESRTRDLNLGKGLPPLRNNERHHDYTWCCWVLRWTMRVGKRAQPRMGRGHDGRDLLAALSLGLGDSGSGESFELLPRLGTMLISTLCTLQLRRQFPNPPPSSQFSPLQECPTEPHSGRKTRRRARLVP
jgi:hypothetical protein